MRHRFAASPFEQRFFVFAPQLGPYSLFRLLGEVLVVPLGPMGAVRALATLPVVATPLALLWARRQLHGDRSATAAYYGIALGFGFMTMLGFASYLLAVAMLLCVVTAWLELMVAADRNSPTARKWEIAVGCLAPILLFAHGAAFVVFVALAGVSTLATGQRWRRIVRVRALVPALALAAWVGWRGRASALPVGSVAVPRASAEVHFHGIYDKLSLLLTPTLLTRTGLDAFVGSILWVIVIAGVVATARSLGVRHAGPGGETSEENGRSRSHSRALMASLAALAVAFFALPHSIGWFGFVDGRLVPLLLLLGLMTVRREALGRSVSFAFDVGAPVAACAMVSIALSASRRFQAEAAGWREVLATVPPQTTVLNLPVEPNSDVFTAHPFIHYDQLIVANRPVVVSDVWLHQGSGFYPTADNPALRLPETYSESDLRVVDWAAYRLADWDYVLIRTRPNATEPRVPAALALATHRGGWWLFRATPEPVVSAGRR
jgi:hypothetical protein